MLWALGTEAELVYRERLPQTGRILVVSNHRSFLDAPLLMAMLDRSVSFACHHYLGQVPGVRDLVSALGCVPLGQGRDRHRPFFDHALMQLQSQRPVGLFPEGSASILEPAPLAELKTFHRGFAHLALQSGLSHLAILPLAIAAEEIHLPSLLPLPWLQPFDPSEPLFREAARHPCVVYRQAKVMVGFPIWITPAHLQAYRGRQARGVVEEIKQQCQAEISGLLRQG